MHGFPRRIYSFKGLGKDLWEVAGHSGLAIKTMWGKTISAQFRQRLMLAVTGVNGCRYCSWLHTKEALRTGLSIEEVRYLLGGSFEDVPENEMKAILYAQHWADTNANPDPSIRKALIETYGEEKVKVIEMALLLIRIGNLTGNSSDYLLYRFSNGKWGLTGRDSH